MAELSHTAKWRIEEIEKATAELRKEILRLETAMDESTGVVQQLKPYPLEQVLMRTCFTGYPSPEAARVAAENGYKASLPIVPENQAIVESNKKVRARLLQLITNAGIPEKVSVKKPRARHRWETVSVDSEWSIALGQHVPVYDSWSSLESSYKDWLRRCDEWRSRLNAEVESKKRAEEAERKKVTAEATRLLLSEKYGLANHDLYDIRQHLIKQNKYLWLAHFLQENREDWNDGPDSARTGLDGFTIGDERDREIYNDIAGYVNDWDGDGRVFRDCKWNYGVLFGIVQESSPELLKDYQKVSEFIQ